MIGPGQSAAAARAHWLAELSEALDEAQRLLLRLGVGAAGNRRATELYSRVEGARRAVESLRLRQTNASGDVSDPKWIESLPWPLGHGENS